MNSTQMPKPSFGKQVQEYSSDPNVVAPGIIAIGIAVWRGISAWANVDFLLSIQDGRFAVIFNFLQFGGWGIITAIALVWLYISYRRHQHQEYLTPTWSLVGASAFIAFMFGTLLALLASGSVPQPLIAYGSSATQCFASVDTSRLQTFRGSYNLALVCVVADQTSDPLETSNMVISNPFDISPYGVSIIANYADKIKAFSVPGITISRFAVLLPKDVNPHSVSRLSDVRKLNGKIVSPGYWQ